MGFCFRLYPFGDILKDAVGLLEIPLRVIADLSDGSIDTPRYSRSYLPSGKNSRIKKNLSFVESRASLCTSEILKLFHCCELCSQSFSLSATQRMRYIRKCVRDFEFFGAL